MTEPQVWTLIGVFAAAVLGVLTLVSRMFVNVLRSELRGVRSEIAALGTRLDNLDRDVQALMRHTFGIDRG